MVSYTYAYLIGTLILGFVWLLFYYLRRDLRHQQMLMSIFIAPLAPITQVLLFYKDYWRPEYVWTFHIAGVPLGAEEVLFAFFIGGIGTVLYEVLFHRKYRAGKKRLTEAVIIILVVAAFIYLLRIAGWNTVWASAFVLAGTSCVIALLDRDIRGDWIMSAIFMFLLVIGFYLLWFLFFPEAVSRFWVRDGLSGIAFLKIPIEEIAWFVSWGAFAGVFYEYVVNAGKYRHVPHAHKRRGLLNLLP